MRTGIGDDYRLRVYDTRLEPRWLEGLLPDLGIGSEPANTYVLGGDFLQPHVLDDAGMSRLRRWGPPGNDPWYMFVVPRHHQSDMVRRVHRQLSVEALDCWVSTCLVVDRAECPEVWAMDAARRLLPELGPVLDDGCG